jgi:hypothetical protein
MSIAVPFESMVWLVNTGSMQGVQGLVRKPVAGGGAGREAMVSGEKRGAHEFSLGGALATPLLTL